MDIIRELIDYFLKNLKAIFDPIVFEILLFDCRSASLPAQSGTGTKGLNFQ